MTAYCFIISVRVFVYILIKLNADISGEQLHTSVNLLVANSCYLYAWYVRRIRLLLSMTFCIYVRTRTLVMSFWLWSVCCWKHSALNWEYRCPTHSFGDMPRYTKPHFRYFQKYQIFLTYVRYFRYFHFTTLDWVMSIERRTTPSLFHTNFRGVPLN